MRLRHRCPSVSIGGFFLLFLSSSCRPADPTTPQSEQTAESPCDPSSVETLIPCVSTARWSRDLAVLAAGPRPPGSKHWQIAQDLCASRFAELGYTVERHQYDTGVNVIGILPGTSADQVVLSAHYDGVEACPAADDNASGVAGVLEAARVLAAGRYAGTLVVACWDDEENGLVGSRAWTARASDRDEPILASFVFEMIGYRTDQPDTQRLPPGVDLVFPAQVEWLRQRQNRGDFIAVVADTGSYWAVNRLETRAAELGLPTLVVEIPTLLLATPLAEPLFRSDHASFWEHGYPGILITDTADYRYARYHCAAAPDSPDALDPEFATLVVRSTVAAIVDTLGLSVPPSS